MGPTTFIVFKQAHTLANTTTLENGETTQKIYPDEDRQILSHQNYAISPKGKEQILILAEDLKKIELEEGKKFSAFIFTPQERSKNTLLPIIEKLREQNISRKEMKNWDEVNMGDLNGLSPAEIKKLYREYHEGLAAPDYHDDAMNQPWPKVSGKETIHFEDYETFAKRIHKITQETFKDYSGQMVAISTHNEPIRNLVMDSIGTEEFYASEFGRNILAKLEKRSGKIEQVQLFSKTLGELGLKRKDFKPNETALIKISVETEGTLHLHHVKRMDVR